MDKEYIEFILKDEEIAKSISKLRTQFSHHISEFYFFNLFVEILKKFNIMVKFEKKTYINNENKPVTDCFISLYEGDKGITTQYDENKLKETLNHFNSKQSELGFFASTMFLIDTFVNLFS